MNCYPLLTLLTCFLLIKWPCHLEASVLCASFGGHYLGVLSTWAVERLRMDFPRHFHCVLTHQFCGPISDNFYQTNTAEILALVTGSLGLSPLRLASLVILSRVLVTFNFCLCHICNILIDLIQVLYNPQIAVGYELSVRDHQDHSDSGDRRPPPFAMLEQPSQIKPLKYRHKLRFALELLCSWSFTPSFSYSPLEQQPDKNVPNEEKPHYSAHWSWLYPFFSFESSI